MRLDALLVRYGYCARREAPALLRSGRVRGRDGANITSPGQHVNVDEVLVDGEKIPFPDGIYVALHKPVGYVCSHAEEKTSKLVFELLPAEWARRNPRVECVGRLDKNTSGLLLFSDDGCFVHRLTSPRKHVPKLYSFETESPIPEEASALFASGGFMLRVKRTRACRRNLNSQTLRTEKSLWKKGVTTRCDACWQLLGLRLSGCIAKLLGIFN